MRVAVVSDIHANRHAFEAVLADVDAADVDEVWCLGDLVGYGGEPDACVELARQHAAICLAGNHDLAVTGDLSIEDFSRGAAISARWTRRTIAEENLVFLRGLEPAGEDSGIGLYHASPRDPVWEYVLTVPLAERCLDAAPQRVSLIGHSHVALAFGRAEAGSETIAAPARGGDRADLAEGEWLLNPGSVGQPRDGDPRAAWLLLDTAAPRAEWRRTEYDVAGAAAAIRAAGLPDSLAERLGYGQ
ncbi:MAG TPA: metallophosphoesterase family protein [Solirubrobacteraceae bacterium]|jgi:diadenosine tetraphosphatase ApaH/serine/threonine PP2A family protein phosphatase|nr:metallophosphoesterase family protein [Solirubrobacteraceae bacterium]